MPVRNGGQGTALAIASVLEELSSSDELIVVDDGSTDCTPEILRSFSDRIVTARTSGSGIVAALNAGLEMAQGELLARCDADDQWIKGRLENQIAALKESGAIACFGGVEYVDTDSRYLGTTAPPLDHDSIRKRLLRTNPLVHGTVLAQRSSFVDAGGYRSVRAAEDYDLWMRLSRAGRLIAVPMPVYRYTISGGTSHAKKRRVQARSSLRVQLDHALQTRELSLVGIARNAVSAVWFGPRGRALA